MRRRGFTATGAAVLALALVASGPARAEVDPPVPVTDATQAAERMQLDGQGGRLRLPYVCEFPIIGPQTLTVDLQGSFDTILGPGQEFWFVDGKGGIETPPNLVQLLGVIGVVGFDATISEFNINASNATPSTVNALKAPLELKDVPLTPGHSANIPIPADGSSLEVGPMKAGPNGTVLLKMGSARAKLTLKNAKGETVLFPLDIRCAAPSPEVVLAGINIGGNDTSVSKPTNNGLYTYPDVNLDRQQGSLKLPLKCTFPGGIGERDETVTMTGDVGTVYGTGERFTFDDASALIQISPETVAKVKARYPGATAIDPTITRFDIDGIGTTPARINVAAQAWKLERQPLTDGKVLGLRAPGKTGYITAGPFTAGAPGVMKLGVGAAEASADLLRADGSKLTTIKVSCAKRDPSSIIVPLVAVKPGGKPTASFLPPANGPVAGGNIVTITGNDLSGIREVFFDGVAAPYLSPQSNNTAYVQAPPHAKGKVPVLIRTTGGTVTVPYTYR